MLRIKEGIDLKELEEEAKRLRKDRLKKTTKEELQQEIDRKDENIRQLVELSSKWQNISFWLFIIIIGLMLFILI